MLKFVTKMWKKNEDGIDGESYELPSDNPELNPVLVEDDGDEVPEEEVVSLNSRLLAPISLDDAGMSVRTRAIVEMKNGLTDLGAHIRSLGQRLHAQSMGQAKLIEALSGLPQTLKEIMPNADEQNKALAALKMALDEQSDANRVFVDALKPLPEFVKTASELPEAARKQMLAIGELTKQLEEGNLSSKEHSEQVKVLVETMNESNDKKSEEMKDAVGTLTKFQKAQLKQSALARKNAELAQRSQRRHQSEMTRTYQNRLTAMQRDQSRAFNRIEDHFRKSSKTQFALTGVAILLAVAAVTFAALMVTGVVGTPGQGDAPATAVDQSPDPGDAVVEK